MIFNEDGTFEVERRDHSFPCPVCRGYAASTFCAQEERIQYDCDPSKKWDCCSRAFICMKCGHRFAMRLPAPEMDW